MELHQLAYFVAVVEEGSFTRAAQRCHVAQPGVSAQIRHLERELGQTLLDRTGRSVTPTEAGTLVLFYARAALGAVAGARLAMDELDGLLRGQLRVGIVPSITTFDMAELIASFHGEHPGIELALIEANTTDALLDALVARELDMAFIGLHRTLPPGIEATVVAEEEFVAVVSPTDPLAGQTSIPFAALAERTLISLPSGTGLRVRIDQTCESAGFMPHTGFEAGDPHLLARLASRGLGVAILPGSVARAHKDLVHVLRVTSPSLSGQIALAWRSQAPAKPAARAFITRTRKFLICPVDHVPAGSSALSR
jgi:DNA-binding transcriptional LysR family regulator